MIRVHPMVLALLVASLSASSGAAASDARRDGSTRPAGTTSAMPVAAEIFSMPVLWLLGAMGVPVEAPALPNAIVLDRERGWQELVFPVRDDGDGVYLEVAGRVEFDRAVVRFGDGAETAIALGGAVRGGGLYVLVEPRGAVRVECVTLRARARSRTPSVGVRLGRAGPAPD